MSPRLVLCALADCAGRARSGPAVCAATRGGSSLRVLREPPAWSLKDVDGKTVNFADFKGKVVVIDFWATWCPPCREEIPGYIEMTKKHGKDGLVIIGISLDQAGPGVVRSFIAKSGINYPIVMGDDATVAAFGGVEGIPTTFLIDREGLIRDKKVGMMAAAEYEKKILEVLK